MCHKVQKKHHCQPRQGAHPPLDELDPRKRGTPPTNDTRKRGTPPTQDTRKRGTPPVNQTTDASQAATDPNLLRLLQEPELLAYLATRGQGDLAAALRPVRAA